MEQEFVKWLFEHQRKTKQGPRTQIGIGDDAAVVSNLDSELVIACDAIADQVHFDLGSHELRRVGRKSVAVNFSDIAAMNATPVYATFGYFLPKSFGLQQATELWEGAAELCSEFGCEVIGGDTNVWSGPLVVTVNVVGELLGPVWTNSNAQPGDFLIVSGDLGGSILDHHLDFSPRLDIAKRYSDLVGINAVTDITDSLSLDLKTMCDASQVGAEIKLHHVPVSNRAATCSQNSGRSPLEHALHDGEDFELLMAVSESAWEFILQEDQLPKTFHKIGTITAETGIRALATDGSKTPLPIKGYVHGGNDS